MCSPSRVRDLAQELSKEGEVRGDSPGAKDRREQEIPDLYTPDTPHEEIWSRFTESGIGAFRSNHNHTASAIALILSTRYLATWKRREQNTMCAG